MNIRQIQEARELYGIDEWGAGYFGINDEGLVVCHPTGQETASIPLNDIVQYCQKNRLRLPLILRFPQVVESQLVRMHSAFRNSIEEYGFQGRHIGVFPFKVNQRREFIDTVVSCGQRFDYGLEVGSKTEMIAALHYPLSNDALLVVNGFKDDEFIDLACIGVAMGKRVVVVAEGPDELQMIIRRRKNEMIIPEIGLRVRLYSRGSGKWENSSGETSKFGLTTAEVLHALKILDQAKLTDRLSMLHFHIGSQITDIKRFKNAIKEASTVYAKVVKLGYSPTFLNIGGGVGVDYDGSKTSFLSSANYSLQEFANDAVYVLGEVCNKEDVPHPTIVTESGRVIAAYHSVVVTDIREVQGEEISSQNLVIDGSDSSELHKSISELSYILEHITRKNFIEYYHDSIQYHEELLTLFSLGYLSLQERAIAEELFRKICGRALYFSSFQRHVPEEFQNLQKLMVSKYLANFSIFQSIPDAWSIDQLFPVMPLSRHHEKPTHKATIVDITCDSDGCIDQFVDHREIKRALDLHVPTDAPYYIGFFLVGAYQESLANEHNLFGAINEAEIHMTGPGKWEVAKFTTGDPIDELLECRNYDLTEMVGSFRHQLHRSVSTGNLESKNVDRILDRLRGYLQSYPYLLGDKQDS